MNSLKKIYFRADGNIRIGLGHFIRSLALADMLKDDFQCIFLIQNPSDYQKIEIEKIYIQYISLVESLDYMKEAEEISKKYLGVEDIVVLDGYYFNTDYQKRIKNIGCKLVCIDDIHSCHFVSDAVINQAGGISATSYSKEENTKLYLGTEYCLVRRPFFEDLSIIKPRAKLDTAVLFLGGSYIQGITQKVLLLLKQFQQIEHINFIIGSEKIYLEEVQEFEMIFENFKVYTKLDSTKIIKLFNESDFVICPASSFSIEACCSGVPVFIGITADNQNANYHFLTTTKCAFGLGDLQTSSVENLTPLFKDNLDILKINESLKEQRLFFNSSIQNNLIGIFRDLC